MGNFNADLQFGDIGETIIMNFIFNHPSTIKVINVSDDKWFQQFDIDFLQVTEDGINKIEVKTDRIAHKTNNMVYELYSNKYSYTEGCFEKTQADYLFYYIIETNILYIFDIYELREWVYKNKDKLKLVNMGDCALGYLIKLKDLKDISIKIKLNEKDS